MAKLPITAMIRVFLGALFLYSGFLKLVEPWQNFQTVIEAYRVIEGDPARWAAQALPWLEAVGGLYLLLGLYTRASAAALWGLNTALIAMIFQALVRKLPVGDCGCFGDALSVPLPTMLVIDIALWFGFGSLFLWDDASRRFSLDNQLARR